jgi:hypothetical protein
MFVASEACGTIENVLQAMFNKQLYEAQPGGC